MSHTHTHDGAEHTHEHTYNYSHEHTHDHTHDGPHGHVHSEAHKKKVINRISKSIGHLESVKRMIERDEDCSDVLIQLAAVRAEINSTGKVVLKDHLSHCIVEAIEQGDQQTLDDLEKAIDMFIK